MQDGTPRRRPGAAAGCRSGHGGIGTRDQEKAETDDVVEHAGAAGAADRPLRREAADRWHDAAVRSGVQHAAGQQGHRQRGEGDLPGEEGRVAGGGVLRIAGVGDPAEGDRAVHEGGRVRAPLELVGVQQPLGGPLPENQVELPGQVQRVAHPGTGTLTEVGRHGVRRVAGQQDPAHPPLLRDAGLEGVDELAQDRDVVGSDVVRVAEQRPGGVERGHLGGVLAVVERELEALPPLPDPHRHVPARRVAGLHDVDEPFGHLVLPLGVDVGPALVEPEVVPLDPEQGSNGAPRAVGAHHPPGTDDLGVGLVDGHRVRVPAGEGQGHAVVVLGEPGERPALPHLDGAETADALVDGCLDVGLVDRQVLRVAGHALRPGHVDQHIAGRGDEGVAGGEGVLERSVTVRGRLHDASGLAVDVGEPREAVEVGPPLDDHHAVSQPAEHRGGDHAGRPVADDGDVELWIGMHGQPPGPDRVREQGSERACPASLRM